MANPPASFLAGFRAATGVQQMRERSRLLAEDRNDRIQAQMIGAQVAKKIDAAFGELEVLRGEFKELDLENDEEFRRFQRKQQITRAQAMTTAIGAISQGMAQAPGNQYLREVMQSQMQNLTAAFQSNVGATARIEQALVGRERTEMEQAGLERRQQRRHAHERSLVEEAGEGGAGALKVLDLWRKYMDTDAFLTKPPEEQDRFQSQFERALFAVSLPEGEAESAPSEGSTDVRAQRFEEQSQALNERRSRVQSELASVLREGRKFRSNLAEAAQSEEGKAHEKRRKRLMQELKAIEQSEKALMARFEEFLEGEQ